MSVEPYKQGGLPEPFQLWLDRFSGQTRTAAWISPVLINSWVDFGAGFQTARYRKNLIDEVFLEGVISTGTATPGTVLFNLGVGYRPNATLRFTTQSGGALAIIDIESNGNVSIFAGTNTSLSLSGIVFHAS